MVKYLTHDKFVEALTEQEVTDMVRQGTTVRPNDLLQKVVTRMRKPKIKRIIEIGTWRGLSSLVMASCPNVEHIWTFDINPSYYPEKLWKKFGLEDKITYICLKDSTEIYKAIKEIPCDFAFIDGSHETEAETRDFQFMKTHCSRILVDDTDDDRVFGIVKPYGAQRISYRFAYWHRDGNYNIKAAIKKDLVWDEPKGKIDFSHLDK